MTIHLFILQSLVSAALYTHVKQGGGPEYQRISYTDMLSQVGFLSQLFRGEFIFPTEGLEHNLAKTLAGLESDNVIELTRSATDASVVEFIELSDAERESGRENFDFYCFLIWPFIEAAWLGAISLTMLTPPLALTHTTNIRPTSSSSSPTTITTTTTTTLALRKHPQIPRLTQKAFQERAQLLGKTLYHQGDLSYFEAVNKETLKNAYTRFEEDGMLIVAKTKDAGTTVRLADAWTPERGARGIKAEGPLWRFAERISASRREGKNRRDGSTVQTRVLHLADVVAEDLWAEAAFGESGSVDEVRESVPKARGGRKRGSMARL